MKVRAIRPGFYLCKRKPGDVFEFVGKPSKIWMEPVDGPAFLAFGLPVPKPVAAAEERAEKEKKAAEEAEEKRRIAEARALLDAAEDGKKK